MKSYPQIPRFEARFFHGRPDLELRLSQASEPARLRTQRANAKRSTGPRTLAGRRRDALRGSAALRIAVEARLTCFGVRQGSPADSPRPLEVGKKEILKIFARRESPNSSQVSA